MISRSSKSNPSLTRCLCRKFFNPSHPIENYVPSRCYAEDFENKLTWADYDKLDQRGYQNEVEMGLKMKAHNAYLKTGIKFNEDMFVYT